MEGRVLIIVGAIIFFPILYCIVCAAVEEGTLNALMEFERLKKDIDKSE
jgi:hypothetical protein